MNDDDLSQGEEQRVEELARLRRRVAELEAAASERRRLEQVLSESNLDTLELAHVIDAPAIQALMDDFFELTRIGVAVLDMAGRVLVATGWQDICTQFHRVHPETCRNCHASDLALSQGVELGTFKAYRCKNNMWDIVTPIVVGGRQLGNLFLGQFLYEDEAPDYEAFRAQARQYGFDESAYLAALERVPRWSQETVQRAMRFYAHFAGLISTLGYSNLALARALDERERAEAALRSAYTKLESFWNISSLVDADVKTICDRVLATILRMTESAYGFYGFVNADESVMTIHAWSGEAMRDCSMVDKPQHFPIDRAGVWGEAVRQRKPLILNRYAADHPAKRGYPDGHVPLTNLLVVPCFSRGQIVTLAAVANRPADYDQDDVAQITAFLTGIQAITDRMAAEEALRRSNEDLEQFAYAVSHDLQEPLRMVSSYVQLLSEQYTGRLDAQADELIGYAVDGAQRMNAMIRGILDYARVRTRGQKPAPTDCEALLRHVLTTLQLAIEDSHAAVTHDPLPTVLADEMQLGRVFLNLLSNALKFHAQQPPRVHVSARQAGGEWLFSVQDNGIGIDPRHAGRLFQLFGRLHGRDEYPGTGIGLALCKRIVERHGGQVWVESQPGQGSTFYFTLPAGQG